MECVCKPLRYHYKEFCDATLNEKKLQSNAQCTCSNQLWHTNKMDSLRLRDERSISTVCQAGKLDGEYVTNPCHHHKHHMQYSTIECHYVISECAQSRKLRIFHKLQFLQCIITEIQ